MKTYKYTDISLGEFPGEISLILYNQKCIHYCPFCFNPDLLNGENLTWKQMKDAIDEHEDFITSVVFSGGEPCLIPHLKKAIQYCKSKGLKIKLNTSGLIDNKTSNSWLPYVDYINCSLKPNLFSSQDLKPVYLHAKTLEYSFVYSPTFLTKTYLKQYHDFLINKISSDWASVFDVWFQPDIFTISQIQVGDCLNTQYNDCKVPNEQDCIKVAKIFDDIPKKKLIVETKEFGRKIV